MSKFRHPDHTIQIRSFGVTFRNGEAAPAVLQATAGWHQLIYASRGVMTVFTEEGAWVVPPHRAVWVPAGFSYRLELSGEVAVRSLYLLARRGRLARRCSVVNVTPLLRELILRTSMIGALDSALSQQRRLIGTIYDELDMLESVPLQLPFPRDERAVRFATLATEGGGNVRVTGMLRQAGASRRTLERIFRTETAMSLGQWLRREKLLRSLKLVAAGQSLESIAMELGYNSASAFVAMFRREMGQTPKRYFQT